MAELTETDRAVIRAWNDELIGRGARYIKQSGRLDTTRQDSWRAPRLSDGTYADQHPDTPKD